MSARERAWTRSNDPSVLWPGADMREVQRAADHIGQATGTILRGEHAILNPGTGARAVGIAALLTGLGPLLGYWVERGMMSTGDDEARLLAEHLAQNRARVARIHGEAAPVLQELERTGARPIVIKGYHTGRVYFPDAGVRPLSDVDVVIDRADIATSESVLRVRGFSSGAPKPGPYKLEWQAPGESEPASFEMWHARSPWQLEVHERVHFQEMDRFGARVDLDGCLAPAPASVGAGLRVLTPMALLAVLTIHTSLELHAARLLRVTELALVIRHHASAGTLDWAEVECLVERWGASRFPYPALSLVERLAPGTVDEGVLVRMRRATTVRARALDQQLTLTTPLLHDALSLRDRLRWARTVPESLRVLLAIVGPTPGTTFAGAVREYHARTGRLLGKLAARGSWKARSGNGA